MIIFIYFKILYYIASYVYQLYFRIAYVLDDSEGGDPVEANPYKILFCLSVSPKWCPHVLLTLVKRYKWCFYGLWLITKI